MQSVGHLVYNKTSPIQAGKPTRLLKRKGRIHSLWGMSETNHTLANLFIAMGELLAVQGANPYRVKAYRRAAETMAALEEDVANIADRDELKKLPGIGKDLSAKIQEFLATGTIQTYEEQKRPLPPEILSWSNLPGFSEPMVNDLYFRLGIRSLDDLEALARSHLLRTRPGMSGTTEEFLAAIQTLREDAKAN